MSMLLGDGIPSQRDIVRDAKHTEAFKPCTERPGNDVLIDAWCYGALRR